MDTLALDRPCPAPRALNAPTGDPGDSDLRTPSEAGQGDTAGTVTGRALAVGRILGSYRLLQQIGMGGMGRVFVAEHVRLGRKVALKVLRSEFSGNQEAVKRFFAEARSVNCISHENIIEVSDFVENPQGPSFYIMELLRGENLCALQSREGILPIVLQVCSGLSAAHDAGIIHRDLKPDNIFLVDRAGRRDFVKLLDFGVAKLMNATVDDASTFRSSVGMVVGTPDYMAPEQALGHAVDHRADVYALGVILFEMVAGRRPFVAKTAREVMVQHLTASVPRPSRLNPAGEVPEALEKLILASRILNGSCGRSSTSCRLRRMPRRREPARGAAIGRCGWRWPLRCCWPSPARPRSGCATAPRWPAPPRSRPVYRSAWDGRRVRRSRLNRSTKQPRRRSSAGYRTRLRLRRRRPTPSRPPPFARRRCDRRRPSEKRRACRGPPSSRQSKGRRRRLRRLPLRTFGLTPGSAAT